MGGYLEHHGILGQKWGIRRFQNKDGSLTADGKKRVSAAYKKAAGMANTQLMNNQQEIYVKAQNRAATDTNARMDKARYQGEDKKMSTKEWNAKWEKEMQDTLKKYYWQEVDSFMQNNTYKKVCDDLVKRYAMTEWDDLAKENAKAMDYLKKKVNGE
jgi:hypothetical protein